MSDSLITKKAIASSIKELMKKKDLQKISVSDITEHCGINRQTFYYHFKDKYDLVNWIYYNEVVTAVVHNSNPLSWSGVMLEVLTDMQKEKHFYMNALSVPGQNAFQDYFFEMTKQRLLGILDFIAENTDSDGRMSDLKMIPQEDKDFIAEFFAYGIVGIAVQWARGGMRQPPEEIIRRMSYLIHNVDFFTPLEDCFPNPADLPEA